MYIIDVLSSSPFHHPEWRRGREKIHGHPAKGNLTVSNFKNYLSQKLIKENKKKGGMEENNFDNHVTTCCSDGMTQPWEYSALNTDSG